MKNTEKFSLVLILVLCLRLSQGMKIETLKHCCSLGTNYANSGLKCTSFQSPVAGIQPEDEGMCLNSIDVCCNNQYRTLQCESGKALAKRGKTCENPINTDGINFQKDCCEACLMGQTSQNCAESLGLGPPYDQAFKECCNEVFSSSSSSSSTTTTEALTEEPKLETRNLSPVLEPPLENPCDISEICAQICIPTADSYKCDCNKGYTLMADGISCKPDKRSTTNNIDRCKLNNPCDQECIDTGTAVKCNCYDGFELAKDKRSCNDIDECALNLHDCEGDEVCVNGEGFYYCDNPENPYSEPDDNFDKKCPEGYKFNGETMVCDDIDECEIDLMCPPPKTCVNTIGSFICKDDSLQCPPGFHFKAATASCEDIDECVTGQDDCNRESQTCLNTKGNFTCIDKVSKKTCPPGFKKNLYTQNCEDINECEENENVCAPNEQCVNEPGGHSCIVIPRPSFSSEKPVFVPTATTQSTTITSTSTTPKITTPTTTESDYPDVVSSPIASSPPASNPPASSPPASSSTSSIVPLYKPTEPETSNQSYYPRRQFYPNVAHSTPVSCPKGFQYSIQYNRCEDVDECHQEYRVCDSSQDCYNTPGSYACRCKAGFAEDVTGACADINECQTGTHSCIDGQRCDNTIGSYLCSRTAGCGTGYTLNYASGLCEDDDECILGTHSCNDLGPKFQCRNTLGSYRCERIRCTDCVVSRIFTSSSTRFTTPVRPEPTRPTYPILSGTLKNCLPGYRMNALGHCEDINECDSNPCERGEKCQNLNGKYRCIPTIQCTRGYELNEERDGCIDVNECVRGLHKCTPSQVCKNGPGYYTCQCPPGHKLDPFTQDCADIDECKIYRGRICSVNADCINTIGSYRCDCKSGYRNKGDACEDVDECAEHGRLCEHNCVNTWGSYRCACKPGFTLNADNNTCSDIDECEKFKDSKLCIGSCKNVPGSYTCTCPPGYRLGSDERVCQDVDECAQKVCAPDDICLNTRGGYRCHVIHCPAGYIRDPDHKSRCKRTTNVCDYRDTQCLKMPGQYSYHFITLVSDLPITPGGIPFFQMKAPTWSNMNAEFSLMLTNAECPHNIRKADNSYFYMQHLPNAIQLFLMKSIEGPQTIELRVEMQLYVNGEFNGMIIANIFIIVSEYTF